MQVNLATQEDLVQVLRRLDKQEKELTILRRLVIENGERISTQEVQRLTGITDIRTLKKRFTWLQKGTGPITWSKSEVLQFITENELNAA